MEERWEEQFEEMIKVEMPEEPIEEQVPDKLENKTKVKKRDKTTKSIPTRIACELCGALALNKYLGKHKVSSHRVCPENKPQFHECSLCAEAGTPNGFPTTEIFIAHLNDSHKDTIGQVIIHTQMFYSEAEFEEFKKYLPLRRMTEFSVQARRTASHFYRCSKFAKPVKMPASLKGTGAKIKPEFSDLTTSCPAFLISYNGKDGGIEAKFCLEHLGHEIEKRQIWVPPKENNTGISVKTQNSTEKDASGAQPAIGKEIATITPCFFLSSVPYTGPMISPPAITEERHVVMNEIYEMNRNFAAIFKNGSLTSLNTLKATLKKAFKQFENECVPSEDSSIDAPAVKKPLLSPDGELFPDLGDVPDASIGTLPEVNVELSPTDPLRGSAGNLPDFSTAFSKPKPVATVVTDPNIRDQIVGNSEQNSKKETPTETNGKTGETEAGDSEMMAFEPEVIIVEPELMMDT